MDGGRENWEEGGVKGGMEEWQEGEAHLREYVKDAAKVKIDWSSYGTSYRWSVPLVSHMPNPLGYGSISEGSEIIVIASPHVAHTLLNLSWKPAIPTLSL